MTKIRVSALVGALLVVTVTGCAGHVGAGGVSTPAQSDSGTYSIVTQSPAAGESASASATPTASAAATGVPAIEDLSMSSEGIEYIRLGEKVPAKPAGEAIVTWNDDFCDWGPENPSGGWDTAYARFLGGDIPFLVQSQGESTAVELIYVTSKKLHTAHGLGIGSAVADLKALGGVLVPGAGPDYLDAWVIHGSKGELVFWVANTSTSETPKGEVGWMQIQLEGTAPEFDFEYGGCE